MVNDLARPTPPFGALILAGGRSSRMGRDKAALLFRGRPLLDHMRDVAAAFGADPVLTGGGPGADLPDAVPGAGPVSSLCALAALSSSGKHPARWIVVPVDMPFLTPALLRRLVVDGAKAASYARRPLPLAITLDDHTRDALARFRIGLTKGESIAVQDVLESLGAAALALASFDEDALVNVNTPEEWARILRRT